MSEHVDFAGAGLVQFGIVNRLSTLRTGHTGVDLVLTLLAPLIVTWLFSQGLTKLRELVEYLLRARQKSGEHLRHIEFVRSENWFCGSDDHSSALQRAIESFLNDEFAEVMATMPSARVKVLYRRAPVQDSDTHSDDSDSDSEVDWRKYNVTGILDEDKWVDIPGWSISIRRCVWKWLDSLLYAVMAGYRIQEDKKNDAGKVTTRSITLTIRSRKGAGAITRFIEAAKDHMYKVETAQRAHNKTRCACRCGHFAVVKHNHKHMTSI